jgi:hypothetical protein
MITWIAADDQPFVVAEGSHFRRMVNCLNPNAVVVSASTVARDMEVIFQMGQHWLKTIFEVSSSYCIKGRSLYQFRAANQRYPLARICGHLHARFLYLGSRLAGLTKIGALAQLLLRIYMWRVNIRVRILQQHSYRH